MSKSRPEIVNVPKEDFDRAVESVSKRRKQFALNLLHVTINILPLTVDVETIN